MSPFTAKESYLGNIVSDFFGTHPVSSRCPACIPDTIPPMSSTHSLQDLTKSTFLNRVFLMLMLNSVYCNKKSQNGPRKSLLFLIVTYIQRIAACSYIPKRMPTRCRFMVLNRDKWREGIVLWSLMVLTVTYSVRSEEERRRWVGRYI